MWPTTRVTLAYGQKGLDVEIPTDATVVAPAQRPGLVDARAALVASFEQPVTGRPLKEVVQGARRVVIVHPDITRPMPNRTVLPAVLDQLEALGIADDAITLLCSTGTHRASSADERLALLGVDIVGRYRTVDHDIHVSDHVAVGDVDGVPVLLDREYVDADVRIVTGFVEPHFFAGFSGGPKAVCPGVAALDTVLEAHAPWRIASYDSSFGRLVGNPVHDFVRAAAALCPPHFSIDVTMNSERQITEVFAGELPGSHLAAASFVGEQSIRVVDREFDVVVTTNSGYPLDQNFYQCGKGLAAAERIVKHGGDIVMVAECVDGIPAGSRLEQQLAEAKCAGDLNRADGTGYLDRWAGQILGRVLSRARISMYSEGLSDAQLRSAFIEPAHDVGAAIRQALARHGRGARVAVLPDGPLTVATVEDGSSDQ